MRSSGTGVSASADGLRVALAQMDVVVGDVTANLARAEDLIRRAAAREADVVLLPELWPTGYDLERSAMHAAAVSAEVLPVVAGLAREHALFIVGSVLAGDDAGAVRNTAIVFGPGGEVWGSYAKTHLFAPMEEDAYLVPGDEAPTFDLPWCRSAIAICYDLRFPELFRTYAAAGATLMLVPAEWPAARRAHWRTLVRARAIDNQCFVAACNRSGTSGDTAFAGHSMVVDPAGEVLTEGGAGEALLVADLDLRLIARARSLMNLLDDRRPDLYDCLQPIPES